MNRIRSWVALAVSSIVLCLSACTSMSNSPSGSKQDTSDIPPLEVVQIFAERSIVELPSNIVVNTSDSTLAPETHSDANLVHALAERFHKPEALIQRVVAAATRFAHDGFPSRDDILAVIAVESGFNPQAHFKGSHGLMQVQLASHKRDLNGRNMRNIEDNVQMGSDILFEYYMALGCNKQGAILAYNAGIGSYLMHHFKPKYYANYRRQLAIIQEMQRT